MLISLLPGGRRLSHTALFIGILAASACSSTLPDATKTTSVKRNKVDVAYSAPNWTGWQNRTDPRRQRRKTHLTR